MRVPVTNKDGRVVQKTMKVSEWAGGYTKQFSERLLTGAQKYLETTKAYGVWNKLAETSVCVPRG